MRKRQKQIYLALLILLLAILYVDRTFLGQLMYPIEYKELIVEQAAQYEVDPYLIAAIIRTESNFKPDKRSAKGAVGLMQLMPPTAGWIAEQEGDDPGILDQLHQPEVNIKYGAWYLRSLEKQFVKPEHSKEEKIALIAAAYNAGPGNVERWLAEGVWDGTYNNASQIPYGETRHYVNRIIYFYQKYEQAYPGLGNAEEHRTAESRPGSGKTDY